jgi:hypothetical protein
MGLWLKLGALAGLRTTGGGEVDAVVVAASFVLGAALGVAGQLLWGAVGPWIVARVGGDARARDLRLAWGASALPLAGVLLLLPLDAALVGSAVFAVDAVGDSIARGWAALSIACGVALALWSLWLFARGVEVAAGLRPGRAALAVVVCIAGCAALVYGLGALARLVASGLS